MYAYIAESREVPSRIPVSTRASDAAYTELKQRIQKGDLPPNAAIDEVEAARQLGISRTPVREALLRLQSEGFVAISRGKGIRVLPLSVEDMKEIYQVITGIEIVAVSLLAGARPSRRMLEPLSRLTQEMVLTLRLGNLDAWGEADENFHRELVRLSGNRRLYAVCCQMRDVVKRGHVIAVRMQSVEYKKGSVANHRKLVDIIMQHSPDEAQRQHYLQRIRGETELIGIIEHYHLQTL